MSTIALGDIIQISAPTNLDLNNHIFLINYLNNDGMILLDDKGKKVDLTIRDGKFTDESITGISILERNPVKGFARQHKLIPDTWVDVYFAGDVPTVVTGKIVSIDEDMIEIETYPTKKRIFLDFAYEGLPSFIEKITIREPVTSLQDEEEKEAPEIEERPPDLQSLLKEGEEIVFGDEDEIVQIVDVPEAERRFGIDNQSDDLLDELLAVIPSNKRTTKTLNAIHVMIERFKELRQQYSIFDAYGQPLKAKILSDDYKPLVHSLKDLKKQLSWILPVVQMKKKLYNVLETAEDVQQETLAATQEKIYEIMQKYKENTIPGDENKYDFLLKKLQPLLTPFTEPISQDDIIEEKEVQNNWTAVVDNLGDFYSTTFGAEKKKFGKKKSFVHNIRFLLDRYVLGLSKLEMVKETINTSSIQKKVVTENDTMFLQSLLFLPYVFVEYSQKNLPNTSLLKKIRLERNSAAYFEILNNKTDIIQKEENNKGLFKMIVQAKTEESNFYEFLEKNIPTSLQLLQIIESKIKYGVSFPRILNYLQPFLIYLEDITLPVYDKMVEHIENAIVTVKKTLGKNLADSLYYRTVSYYDTQKLNKLFHPLPDYNITKPLTDVEMLIRIIVLDGARVFTTRLSLENIDLHGDVNIEDFMREIEEEKERKPDEDNCPTYVLAKRYIEIDELENDNNRDIYFDKQYDVTRYEIFDEFKVQRASLDKKDLKDFITGHLHTNIGLDDQEARREAEALIAGKRRVVEGEFAMLVADYNDFKYYKRVNNRWELAEEVLQGKRWTDIFCNMQKKCLNVEGKCNNEKENKIIIKENMLKEMVTHYEEQSNLKREVLLRKLQKEKKLFERKLIALERLAERRRFKYDTYKANIALTYEPVAEIPKSPYTKIITLILGQSDFIKKQNDIIKFVGKFCRLGDENNNESPFWYYDAETGAPLLPTFLKVLADAFEENRYNEELQQIAADQGRLSDSGDSIVDKHSGYIIKKLDYVTLEAYDEKGFKIISRDLLEEDLGKGIVHTEKKFESKEAQMIFNVVGAMSNFLNISVNSEIDFIIKNVIEILREIIPAEEIYNKRRKKGKPYADIRNNALLLITLSYLIIVVQTMIPSVRTSKTFPGCKRSFKGYPFDGTGDESFIRYISCIVFTIKLEGDPWKTLKKRKKKGISRDQFKTDNINTLAKNIRSLIGQKIIMRTEVEEKIKAKKEYLMTAKEKEEIPDEHNITHWLTFLPPLQLIRTEGVRNVGKSFFDSLQKNIGEGSEKQNEQLSIIKGKIILFSMAIQQSIQRVVNKEAPLLKNSIDEPFLENVCCNIGSKNTIKYFAEREQSIVTHNDDVFALERKLEDVRFLSVAPYLYDPRDTKLVYPPIPDNFTEETIYRAFMRYCRFNSGFPLDEELQELCIDNKSAYLITNTFEERMEILKREGREYTPAQFNKLLLIIQRRNIVDIDLEKTILTPHTIMAAALESLDSEEHKVLTYLRGVVFNPGQESKTKLLKYLELSISEIKDNIQNFIERHSVISSSKKQKIIDTIRDLVIWRERGQGIFMSKEKSTEYYAAEFLKEQIYFIAKQLPTIILNKVDYTNVPVPKYWHLSGTHKKDIQNIVEGELGLFQGFSENIHLTMKNVVSANKSLFRIISVIPFFATDENFLNATLYRQLMQFFFLEILESYIHHKETRVTTKKEPESAIDAGEKSQVLLTEMDIVVGEMEEVEEEIASLLIDILKNYGNHKKIINMNNQNIHDKILKAKEKEKNKITQTLKDLSIEQRKIENVLKTHRLGKWNVGQTRALFEYDANQYEKERAELEADALLEHKLGKMDEVTAMNRDIYRLDLIREQEAEKAAWQEATDISDLPEDDDYGDRDGDEGF